MLSHAWLKVQSISSTLVRFCWISVKPNPKWRRLGNLFFLWNKMGQFWDCHNMSVKVQPLKCWFSFVDLYYAADHYIWRTEYAYKWRERVKLKHWFNCSNLLSRLMLQKLVSFLLMQPQDLQFFLNNHHTNANHGKYLGVMLFT